MLGRERTINLNLGGTLNLGGALTIALVPPPPPPIQSVTTAKFGNFTATGYGNMAYTLPDDMQVALTISYVDKNGNPANIDGDVVWVSSDENVARVIPTNINQNVEVMLVPAQTTGLGTCQISATADADLGDGTSNIVTLFDVQIVAGTAVSGTVTPGVQEPYEQDRAARPRR